MGPVIRVKPHKTKMEEEEEQEYEEEDEEGEEEQEYEEEEDFLKRHFLPGKVLTPSIDPDVHLVSNSKKSHPAHWVALVACGDHFRVMRESGMKEAIENRINVDAEDETVDAFLHWVYFEELKSEKLSNRQFVELLVLSELWQLNHLESTIRDEMQNFSDASTLEFIAWSLKLDCQSAAKECIVELLARQRTKGSFELSPIEVKEIETLAGDSHISCRVLFAAIRDRRENAMEAVAEETDLRFLYSDLDKLANFTIKGKENSQIRVYRPVLFAASPRLRSTVGAEQTSLDCFGDQRTLNFIKQWLYSRSKLPTWSLAATQCLFSVALDMGIVGICDELTTTVETRTFTGKEVMDFLWAHEDHVC